MLFTVTYLRREITHILLSHANLLLSHTVQYIEFEQSTLLCSNVLRSNHHHYQQSGWSVHCNNLKQIT